jgi:hypothetical protein
MLYELKTLKKHPLAACLGAALTLGGPLLAAVPPTESHQAAAGEPLHAFLSAASLSFPAALRHDPAVIATARHVTNCNDSGAGSLRDVIAASDDQDAVDLTDLRCSTITLTSGAIGVTLQHLHIYSRNLGAVTIDGGGTDRIFNHQPPGYGRLYLQGVNVTNGSSAGNGGCIYSSYAVYLNDVVISNCRAHTSATQASGGAIYTKSNLTLGNSKVISSEAVSDETFATGGGLYVGGNFSASYSAISGNYAHSNATTSYGGGAFLRGRTYISNTTIDNNKAVKIGGIALVGGRYQTAQITSSTISGNSASGFIGGVYSDVQLKLVNSTIAFNCAVSTGLVGYIDAIGLQNNQAPPDIQSSIIANNTICEAARPAGVILDTPYDISFYGVGAITGANNLIVTSAVTLPADTVRSDPQLAPLADNGGTTRTHALSSTSPAIDAGNNAANLPFDQRSMWSARVVGAAADIGAFELQSIGPTRQVANCDDSGTDSLRDVVGRSQSGDGIDLSALTCSSITLTNGAIEIPQGNLRLIGPGAQALKIDANNQDRVLHHSGSGTLELQGLMLVNGYSQYTPPSETFGTGGCLRSAGRILGDDVVLAGCKAQTTSYTCFGGGAFALDLELKDSVVSHNSCTSMLQTSAGGGLGAGILVLDRTTVSDNIAAAPSDYSLGGGFAGLSTETVTSSTVSGNRADRGGGGFFATMKLTNSTISGNSAFGKAGGLYGIYLQMFNSTVAFNANTTSDAPAAGGIYVVKHSELESSIVSGNTQNSTPYDFGGVATLLIGANNLIGVSTIIPPLDTITDDPHLGPLQDNGGPTLTHALLQDSPAIDAGNNVADLADDQRGDGFARVSGASADIGAYETQTVEDRLFASGFDPQAR